MNALESTYFIIIKKSSRKIKAWKCHFYTCLVLEPPKLLMYISYSLIGCKSNTSNSTASSSIICRSSMPRWRVLLAALLEICLCLADTKLMKVLWVPALDLLLFRASSDSVWIQRIKRWITAKHLWWDGSVLKAVYSPNLTSFPAQLVSLVGHFHHSWLEEFLPFHHWISESEGEMNKMN